MAERKNWCKFALKNKPYGQNYVKLTTKNNIQYNRYETEIIPDSLHRSTSDA